MSPFLQALRAGPVLADGAMGSYIFELTGRLSEANHFYEAFSVERPEIVRDVCLAYLQAGSRCLTTNTFAANGACLAAYGLQSRAAELSAAAVRLARQAIADYCRASGDGEREFYVLGSLGPTADGEESADELDAAYAGTVRGLLDAGVDALLLETFRSLAQLRGVLAVVRRLGSPVPVIAHMSLELGTAGWSCAPADLVRAAEAGGAAVVGINCCTPWDAETFVAAAAAEEAVAAGRLLLSAMPNAGGFQHIGNRHMTRVNPEFMGRLARTLTQLGVRLVGGCCEIHPRHVWEMHNYLHGRAAGARGQRVEIVGSRLPVGPDVKAANGGFSRKLFARQFAVSVELLPARGTGPKVLQGKVDFVGQLAGSGLADALDITDGSRGIPLMPPGDFIHVLRQGLGWTAAALDGLELIPHFTARDLNVMGVQARLLGYWANRIHNVLFITGDPPKMAPTYPPSTAVFDLNSVDMIRYTHSCLNAGVDFGHQPLGKQPDPRTRFTIGTGFEPEALDAGGELAKLHRKLDAGADYVMTQPSFRWEPLEALSPFRDRVPILVGVLILSGLEHAARMRDVPGVAVPQDVVDRLGAQRDSRDQARVGRDIAAEQIRRIRSDGWSGLYLMSPASHEPVLDVLRDGLG